MEAFELDAALQRAAEYGKPRVFAVYGRFKRRPEEPLLGWGMELPSGGALFRLAGDRSVHSADSAAQVLEVQSLIADVELKWLD